MKSATALDQNDTIIDRVKTKIPRTTRRPSILKRLVSGWPLSSDGANDEVPAFARARNIFTKKHDKFPEIKVNIVLRVAGEVGDNERRCHRHCGLDQLIAAFRGVQRLYSQQTRCSTVDSDIVQIHGWSFSQSAGTSLSGITVNVHRMHGHTWVG